MAGGQCGEDGCKNYQSEMDFPQNHYFDLKQEEPSGAEQGGGGEGGGGGDRPVIRLYISPCLSITSIVLRTVIRI